MIFLVIRNIIYNNTFTQPGTEFSLLSIINLDGMDTYLLLRNNRQSGPFSLEQLVSFGLKPYDLVWVEGRSAAWRYPSEVDGLKAYAPVTEEQPYDRFYKKPEEKPQVTQVIKPAEPQPKSYVPPKEEAYVLPAENNAAASSRKVFVAMPENHVTKKQSQPAVVKAAPIVEEKPGFVAEKVAEEKKVESKPVYNRQEIIPHQPVLLTKKEPIVRENPIPVKEEPTLDEKYSESLDDIKRRYTETYLNRKKKSRWTSTHKSVLQVFGGAVFFCLLVVFAYKNFGGEDQPQSKTTMILPDKRAINTSTTTPVTSTLVPTVVPETNKAANKKTQTRKEETNISTESIVNNPQIHKNEELPGQTEIASVEKKAVMPKPAEEKPEEMKPKVRPININRLVSVEANNYKQRAFGGVMNLELTVNNDSRFDLDRVVVELQYLKPSEQPIKTETIVFSAVEANGSKTLKIPDYLRGIKVAYRVMEIESSQYDSYTAGL
jgi:hypothetical protein